MTTIAYPAPPRADADETVYAALRAGLHDARYYDHEVREYTGLEDIGALVRLNDLSTWSTKGVEHALSALCHMFLRSHAIRETELRPMLGDAFVDAGLETGLIGPYEEHPGTLRALVSLYPLPDVAQTADRGKGVCWVASDRLSGTEAERSSQPDDVVFCPLAATGVTFLGLMPRTPCRRFVEVCAGCGPAALLSGGFAAEVTASDLAGRSVAFARFAARLNGLSAMRTLQGASYEGLEGQFDRIVAHPPYMPTLGSAEIYYAGGSTGMDVTESLIRQLPERLAPGGLFYATTMLFEGPECSAEQRIRQWLGSEESSYDVILFPLYFHSLLEAAQRAAIKAKEGYEGLERAFNRFAGDGFQNAVVCVLMIHRHDAPFPPATARRRIGERAHWKHLLWSLEVERQAALDGDGSAAMAATYHVCSSVELVVTHRPSPEGFAAAGFKLKTATPFAIETQVDGWMSYLLARADGTMTGRELYESCIADSMILPQTPSEEFAKLLWMFAGGAVLESSLCTLPKID